jgi:hypothetical protein
MKWLLQTIEDPETARRFVVAQYQRARISYPVMAEVAREWGWINLIENEVQITPTLPVLRQNPMRTENSAIPRHDRCLIQVIPSPSNAKNLSR